MIKKIKSVLKLILPPSRTAFQDAVSRILNLHSKQNKELTQLRAVQREQQSIMLKAISLLEEISMRNTLNETQLENMREQQTTILIQLEQLQEVAHSNCNIEKQTQVLQKQNNELSLALEKQKMHLERASRMAEEATWAAVFNNTISESEWLKKKTFSPGRWAMGYPALYTLYRVLNEIEPRRILELGLGQSTRMIGQYAMSHVKTEHFVVEQDEQWIHFFQQAECKLDATKILHIPVHEVHFLDDDRTLVYQNFTDRIPPMKYDLIVIDAPGHSRSLKYRRIDALQLVPDYLAESFCILLDDSNDPYCIKAYDMLLKKLTDHNIEYKKGTYRGSKDMLCIASKDSAFLCSM